MSLVHPFRRFPGAPPGRRPVRRRHQVLSSGRAPGVWRSQLLRAARGAQDLRGLAGWLEALLEVDLRLRDGPLFGSALESLARLPRPEPRSPVQRHRRPDPPRRQEGRRDSTPPSAAGVRAARGRDAGRSAAAPRRVEAAARRAEPRAVRAAAGRPPPRPVAAVSAAEPLNLAPRAAGALLSRLTRGDAELTASPRAPEERTTDATTTTGATPRGVPGRTPSSAGRATAGPDTSDTDRTFEATPLPDSTAASRRRWRRGLTDRVRRCLHRVSPAGAGARLGPTDGSLPAGGAADAANADTVTDALAGGWQMPVWGRTAPLRLLAARTRRQDTAEDLSRRAPSRRAKTPGRAGDRRRPPISSMAADHGRTAVRPYGESPDPRATAASGREPAPSRQPTETSPVASPRPVPGAPRLSPGDVARLVEDQGDAPLGATADRVSAASLPLSRRASSAQASGPGGGARSQELPAPDTGHGEAFWRRRRKLPAEETPDEWPSGPGFEAQNQQWPASGADHGEVARRGRRKPAEETPDEWMIDPAAELPPEETLEEGAPRLSSPWPFDDESWFPASAAPSAGAPSAGAPATAEAPAATTEDPDELAEKIRRILGEEARRHGIDV